MKLVIFTVMYIMISSDFTSASPNEHNNTNKESLSKDITRLNTEVVELRIINELKKSRDTMRAEKETLVSNIGGESKSKISKEVSILKEDIARLTPISALVTQKRSLTDEKKTLSDNINSK